MDMVLENKKIKPYINYKGNGVFEISTGFTVSAKVGDRIKELVFTTLNDAIPRDVLSRDIEEAIRRVQGVMLSKNINKDDIVKVTLRLRYLPDIRRLDINSIRVERIYTEEDVNRIVEAKIKELKSKLLEEIKKILS